MDSWQHEKWSARMKKYSAIVRLARDIIAMVIMAEKAILLAIEIMSKVANCGNKNSHANKLQLQLS